ARTPRNRQVLELLAQLLLESKDWVGAQEIAEVLRQLKDGQETEATADRIDAAALGGLERYDESIELLQSSQSNGVSKTTMLPDLIRAYVQAGRQDAAVIYLQNLLDEDPSNSLAYVLLGSVFMSQDDTERAEEAFRQAARDDENALGDTSLAQFYLVTEKLEAAEKAVLAGLEKDENSSALRLMLSVIYQQVGRFDDAIDQYEILFVADPESTIVANDLASLLSERRGDPQSLQRAYEIAQRFRNSEIPQYLDTLGWIYYLQEEYSDALPLLRSAATKLPDVGLIQFHYGAVLAELGQDRQAIQYLEEALSLETLMTDEDKEKAVTILEKLNNKNSESVVNEQG
ncbi:MAG: tetratricopeptide repeat protein, partial [Pseudomonadota bacterium]